jgi:glutamine amidotransferase
MIAIVDYGMGNLRSVQKAFESLGFDARTTDNKADILNASHIVLPGVVMMTRSTSWYLVRAPL